MYDESHASKRKSQEDESLKDNAKQKKAKRKFVIKSEKLERTATE